MPECPIRAPFSALPRFMPQNISSKSFFFQQAKVFCQTKSNKKKKKERKTEPEEHLQMLQMSKKCCKYRSGKVVEQNCENWNENYPLWLWQQHFNLSCHFARASCSIRHSLFSICHFPFSTISKSLRLCILFMSHRSTLLVIFCSICAAAQRWRRRQDNKKNYFHFIQLEHI